jgi:tungstate transport system ATP-binding protein
MTDPAVRPGPPGSPLFSLRDVSVCFGLREVLCIPRLDIPAGMVTVLLGENGSGKTTLLRILNGLMEPARGTVEYRGTPLSSDGARLIRRDSVLLHQSVVLFRGTVFQNVAYGLRTRKVPAAHVPGRVAEALSLVGLGGFERRRSAALSGGERQRVALARALALRTPVLLLDEPAASIDAENRVLVESAVRSIAAAGATVIMSSHSMDFAYRLSDRTLLVEGGRVSPGRENILRGAVTGRDEQFTHFTTGPCTLRCPARDGEFAVAVLPFDDVILSLAPLVSSARNQMNGRVAAVQAEGGLLCVTVDCGVPIRTLVTRESAGELGVEPGLPCVVTFKASAVRLF